MDFGDRSHVDAARRLVADDDAGFLYKSLADHDLLLVAARQLHHASIVVYRPAVESSAPLRGKSAHCATAHIRQALEPGREQRRVEVLGDRHRLEEAPELAVLGDVD